MSDRLDMTLMYATHNALRRDLGHIARVTANISDEPRRILATAAGWGMFKKALHIHLSAEDDALWPAVRQAVAGWPDDLALVAAMEAEHAVVGPLVAAIDAALTDPDSGSGRLGALTGELADALHGHLKHEEDEALLLIQVTVPPERWAHFGDVHSDRTGPDTAQLMPWLLEGADEQAVAAVLAPLPNMLRTAYRDLWEPAYAALDKWDIAGN